MLANQNQGKNGAGFPAPAREQRWTKLAVYSFFFFFSLEFDNLFSTIDFSILLVSCILCLTQLIGNRTLCRIIQGVIVLAAHP